ncbi:MAG TPA: hypothetical protein VGY97_13140 [Solirubrobacteraceae bacterium]|nr:hypothetical protein [Solirubrobacteraceae bacterium]
MGARRRKLELELDADADPIAGSVSDEQGATHSFTGWLGLASALHKVLNGVDGDGMTREPPDAGPVQQRRFESGRVV